MTSLGPRLTGGMWLWAMVVAGLAAPRICVGQTIVRTLGASDDRGLPGVAASAGAWQAPIPPLVQGQAVQAEGGGHCYSGAHPNTLGPDTPDDAARWHEASGPHTHTEAPLDLRLFAYENRCYHFTGDPSDFGHFRDLYAYHGMHPIPAPQGGGWCYQDGAHNHTFRYPSPHMQRIGNRYFWGGGFDAEFRVYYPYFVHFFRDHYPLYYARGRYADRKQVAPPFDHVPLPAEMLSWGPGPESGGVEAAPERQAAPEPAPAAAAPGTTVIVQQPAGYGVGFNQLWGNAFAPGFGFYDPPRRGGAQNRTPPNPSVHPNANPPPAPRPPPAPPAPSPSPAPYSGQTIVR